MKCQAEKSTRASLNSTVSQHGLPSGGSDSMPTSFLRWNLLLTDIGFLLYWIASALSLLPPEWLYKDHGNPILMAWNWSFVPVDFAASASGLAALWLARAGRATWSHWALVSLSLTFCAGLMAVTFWSLRADFEFSWWVPNLYLVAWPAFGVCSLLPRSKDALPNNSLERMREG